MRYGDKVYKAMIRILGRSGTQDVLGVATCVLYWDQRDPLA